MSTPNAANVLQSSAGRLGGTATCPELRCPRRREAVMKRYAYAWLTAGFFLVSIILHWLFGW